MASCFDSAFVIAVAALATAPTSETAVSEMEPPKDSAVDASEDAAVVLAAVDAPDITVVLPVTIPAIVATMDAKLGSACWTNCKSARIFSCVVVAGTGDTGAACTVADGTGGDI
jgi:hypothetical protein